MEVNATQMLVAVVIGFVIFLAGLGIGLVTASRWEVDHNRRDK